jgi:hypothetical protein
MSYIIRGILDGVLPWGLVLFGVAIALVLELCQVPSLPFAVGLYLPLSSSTPIVVGGLVRWAVTRGSSGAAGAAHDEGESGPGVLFASGYIAGGAMAGIVFAALSAGFEQVDAALRSWAEAHNPMYEGPYADALSLLPFLLLAALLYRVARTASPNGRRVDGS